MLFHEMPWFFIPLDSRSTKPQTCRRTALNRWRKNTLILPLGAIFVLFNHRLLAFVPLKVGFGHARRDSYRWLMSSIYFCPLRRANIATAMLPLCLVTSPPPTIWSRRKGKKVEHGRRTRASGPEPLPAQTRAILHYHECTIILSYYIIITITAIII